MPIHDLLRAELGIDEAVPASGGCIHACYRVRMGAEAGFLKVNAAQFADAFAAEADGLEALRAAAIAAPAPKAHGIAGDQAFVLLEFLELRAGGDFAALGRMLAGAHRRSSARFGWPRDNYIGTSPQPNGWRDSWAQFWLEQRMRPQLELAKRNGFHFDCPPLDVLEGHHAKPALLHGDLWSGNAGFTSAGPVLFDPAVYYGDREADLAMTELFGGFPRAFYAAYEEMYPLERGYERRKHLYNLYHLLNHLNLFGAGYLAQVKATLRLLFGR